MIFQVIFPGLRFKSLHIEVFHTGQYIISEVVIRPATLLFRETFSENILVNSN